MMRTTRPPVVVGLSLALQAASSDTSTSTTATIQASYAIAPDFFNGLLGDFAIKVFGDRLNGLITDENQRRVVGLPSKRYAGLRFW
jgi:hypothetical protein